MKIQTDGKFDKTMEQIGEVPVVGWILYIPLMIISGPFRHSWKNALVGLAILGGAGSWLWYGKMGGLANASILAASAMIVGSIWFPGEDSYIDTLLNGDK